MSIPSDIASYLTPDEKMIKIGRSRKWEIYVTDKRVIFKKGRVFGRHIVEASYRHISSIEYKKRSPWGGIVIGIVLIVWAFIIRLFLNDFFLSVFKHDIFNLLATILMGVVGMAVIVASLFITPEYTLHVVGRSKPLRIPVRELEEIFKIIRQYRERVEVVVVTYEKEPKKVTKTRKKAR